MTNKEIIVRITKNYGREAIYPVNETAERFAAIHGTKTIDRWLIEQIKALGYEVKVEQQVI